MTNTPARFRKKPVEIEAMRLVGDSSDTMAVYRWIEENTQGSFDPMSDEVPGSGVSIDPATGQLMVATLEGVMHASYGYWIIRGVQGEFYPCKADIFDATYEPVEVKTVTDSSRHPGTVHLLSLFDYTHLPPHLQAVSKPLHDLAHDMADRLNDGPELSAGLRNLWDAKNNLVMQAVLDARKRRDA
jgi:hypothetical protein